MMSPRKCQILDYPLPFATVSLFYSLCPLNNACSFENKFLLQNKNYTIFNTWNIFCFIKFTCNSCSCYPSKIPSVSKKQLSARMKRKTLNLNYKIKLIDLTKKNPTFGCRKFGEIHGIGKTSVASMLQNEENTRKEFEKFEGKSRESVYFLKNLIYWNHTEWIDVSVNSLCCTFTNNTASFRASVYTFSFLSFCFNFLENKKKIRPQTYQLIIDVLYNWYTKCCSANVHPDGAVLQEEALLIKEQQAKLELEDFNALNGWLGSFRKAHGIRKYWISGKGENVALVTVKTWLERLLDGVKDYEPCNQWNLDELGLLLEAE